MNTKKRKILDKLFREFRTKFNHAIREFIRKNVDKDVNIITFSDKRSDHIRVKFVILSPHIHDNKGRAICKKINKRLDKIIMGPLISCEWWSTKKNYMYPGVVIKYFNL